MNIGKLIKTGLAIYGGTVLVKKLGRYIFEKNKDKIAAKIKEKIIESCDKAIDDIFHSDKKQEPRHYHTSDVLFGTADDAYNGRQRMIDIIHDFGFATMADLYNVAGVDNIDEDTHKYGWRVPEIFESAYIERVKTPAISTGYGYYIDTLMPEKLEDIL